MTRVAIIGNAGGGKSPLARRPVKSGEVTTYRAADRVQWLPKRASGGAGRCARGLLGLVNKYAANRDVFHIRSVRELKAFRRAHGC